MMWFDKTGHSVVAGCRQCGTRTLASSMAEADRWAMAHVERAHPAPTHEHMQAITASRVRRHRDTR